MNIFWLAADQPDEGERHVRESLASWSERCTASTGSIMALVHTELYRRERRGCVATHYQSMTRLRRNQLFACRSFGSRPGFCAQGARWRWRRAGQTAA